MDSLAPYNGEKELAMRHLISFEQAPAGAVETYLGCPASVLPKHARERRFNRQITRSLAS